MEFEYKSNTYNQFYKKWITINNQTMLNFSTSNFLGLDNNPYMIDFIKKGISEIGFGFSSGPYSHGIHKIHARLEQSISSFFDTENTVLNSSCYETNIGLIPAILSKDDTVFSDELNHASIIDGIRLSKAKCCIFPHMNYSSLEDQLKDASQSGLRLIVTNGSFSMEGTLADLRILKKLALKYNALLMVDETFAIGVIGENGRGAAEYYHLNGNIDIITGSFGTALGGFNGGFATGKSQIIEKIRKKSRTYRFSSLIAPASVFAAQTILDFLIQDNPTKSKLESNVKYLKEKMSKSGFYIFDNPIPVIPIVFNEINYGRKVFKKLLDNGIYISFFSYPAVPKKTSRLRIEISAIHSKEDLDVLVNNIAKIIDYKEIKNFK